MKKVIYLLLLLISFIGVSCSKSSPSTPQDVLMEVGIYEGTYSYIETNTIINKFQIELTKIDASNYQIKQIDIGKVPTFKLVDKSHNYPFIFFTVASQVYNSQNFSGNGNVSGGYDALFNTSSKSLYFSITFENNVQKTIYFTGYKK